MQVKNKVIFYFCHVRVNRVFTVPQLQPAMTKTNLPCKKKRQHVVADFF